MFRLAESDAEDGESDDTPGCSKPVVLKGSSPASMRELHGWLLEARAGSANVFAQRGDVGAVRANAASINGQAKEFRLLDA